MEAGGARRRRQRIDRERGTGKWATLPNKSSPACIDQRCHARACAGSHRADSPDAARRDVRGRMAALSERAAEPNGYYLPGLGIGGECFRARPHRRLRAQRVERRCRTDRPDARHLDVARLQNPLPVLVSADPYGTLCTPLLDRDMPEDAGLHSAAGPASRRACADPARDLARWRSHEGIRRSAAPRRPAPHVLQSHLRACLDARHDADELLRDALGAKKLKELRRQRNRLAEHGDVTFHVARTPNEVAAAAEIFLSWKPPAGRPSAAPRCCRTSAMPPLSAAPPSTLPRPAIARS